MAKEAAKTTAKKAPRKAGTSAGQKLPPGTDMESVRQLVRLMVENELTEIKIANGEVEVHLKRGVGGGGPAAGPPVQAAAPQPAGAAAAAELEPAPQTPAEPHAEELLEIKSPMVGTFYSAPSPDSDPYVPVGSSVTDETVVCIIEAMKVMNEIKAECAGTVVEVCVQNAQPVEYGQTLYRVRPY